MVHKMSALGGFRLRHCLVLGAVAAASFAPKQAHADDATCVDGAGRQLAVRDARARLVVVRDRLVLESQRATTWSAVWAATGTALVFGNFARVALASDADGRIDPLVSGTASLFIPAAILLKPLRVIHDSEVVRADAAAVVDGGADACAALAGAEDLLAKSAADEADKAGPLAHVVTFGGNAAIGVLLAVAFKHGWSGLLNAVGGVALGELQIATQPKGLTSARESTEQGTSAGRASASAFVIAPLVTKGATGFLLTVHF